MGKWTLWFFSVAMTAFLIGCGDSKTAQNAPPPPPSNLSIGFDPAPPGTVLINATATFTAVVSNDSSNAGVDWSLTCQNSSCGSLSPLHTSSGASATYTPPQNLPGNSQTVNIVAFATADHSTNTATPLTVTAFGSNLKGTYVFQTRGVDETGAYQFAGVAVLDGNGGITSGEQTYSNQLQSVTDPITGGSYFIGPDGRGTLTLNTANQNLGQLGVETFSLVFISGSQALIAKVDDPNNQAASNETSSGSMDLQNNPTAPTGGYAFVVSGTDIASLSPTAFGGVLNIDSPKTISGAGSVTDQDVAGSVTYGGTVSGTVSDPDPFGMVRFNLTASFTSAPIELTGYIVDTVHIKLIESDNGSGAGFASTAGVAIGQGAATGSFTGNPSFSGNFVFGIFGEDLSGLPASFASAGVFTADGNGNLTGGFNDAFLAGLFARVHDQFTGTYAVDANGTGRVDSFTTFRSHHRPGPELIFYLTGNGNPPVVLAIDGNLGALGQGTAYPQAAPPFSFNGPYGVGIAQSSFGSEIDSTSQLTVDGAAGTLSGIVDTNFFFSPVPNTPLTGTFNAIPDNGRFDGELSNELFFLPTLSLEYYLIDSGHGFFVETDSLNSGELTLGYFAARTRVCAECP